jgi:hypothetical protein
VGVVAVAGYLTPAVASFTSPLVGEEGAHAKHGKVRGERHRCRGVSFPLSRLRERVGVRALRPKHNDVMLT